MRGGGSGGLDGSCSSFSALMKSTTIVLRSLAMSSGMCSSLLLSSYCRPGSHNWSGVYSGPFLLGLAALFIVDVHCRLLYPLLPL